MDNIHVYLQDLPTAIGEMVMPCLDGYTVFINSRLSSEMQRKCFEHALDHVRHNDWEKENVDEIEYERHKGEK